MLENRAAHSPRELPVSATLVTDASMQGWDGLLLEDTGEVLAAGGAWNRPPHMIAQAEARSVELALRAFKAQVDGLLDIRVDNTTFMHIMEEGNTHTDPVAMEAKMIDGVLRAQDVKTTWRYVASKSNPADGISRGKEITKEDLAKRWNVRRGAREAGWGAASFPLSSVILLHILRAESASKGLMPSF